jgi:hypothetical protein
MEFFGWPPGVVEELSPAYQDALLVMIAERRKAQREAIPK